jgi:LPS export ABC transporter protein LptC
MIKLPTGKIISRFPGWKKWAAGKGMTGIALLLSVLVASCSNSMKEINELVSQSQAQEDRGKDVTVLYSDAGKIKVRMFTHELIRNDAATPAYTDMKNGLKVEFFNDSSVVKNTLTARSARWYSEANNILIRDSVVVVNDRGERLETQELVWNQSIKKFFTEKPVSIATATQIIYGVGMEANQDFSWYKILKPTGTVRVNKNEVPVQ